MRLVKKSINQDAPDTYHLFYADEVGTPGTDLTFFPWPDLPRARLGAGQVVEVPFAVPMDSLPYWQDRFAAYGITFGKIETRFGEQTLPFEDPHGLRLALVETKDARDFVAVKQSPVPAEHQLRGMHAVRLLESSLTPTETLLTEVMGFQKIGEADGWHRYGVDGGGSGKLVEVNIEVQRGSGGVGGVHHAAWRVEDDETEMRLRDTLEQVGLRPTLPIDRFWFQSVYFREPGGVLFELATEGPGFTRDEDLAHLGEALILPPWLEPQRAKIESSLVPLKVHHS